MKLSEIRHEADVSAVSSEILRTGSVTKAAIALGKSRMTIYRILKRANLPLNTAELLRELRRQQSLKFVTQK